MKPDEIIHDQKYINQVFPKTTVYKGLVINPHVKKLLIIESVVDPELVGEFVKNPDDCGFNIWSYFEKID